MNKMRKLIILFSILLLTTSAKTQQTFNSYKNNFILYKNKKFVTESENYVDISFILNENILYVADEANSRYLIHNNAKIDYDKVGKYTSFSAIDEQNRKCTLILFVPFDKSNSSMLSVIYTSWGVVYFIK